MPRCGCGAAGADWGAHSLSALASSKVFLNHPGLRPGCSGLLLVILERRLGYHRVDSCADSGNSHCFMALMSGASVLVNDERLLRSSPWERHCIEWVRAFLCPSIVRTGISRASWSVKRTNHTAIRYRAVLSLRSILIVDCPSGSSSIARSALCCHEAGSVTSSFSLQRAHTACDPLSHSMKKVLCFSPRLSTIHYGTLKKSLSLPRGTL